MPVDINFNKQEKSPQPEKKKRPLLRTLIFILAILVSLSILGVGFIFAYNQIYKNKVFSGVYVGQYHLRGMTENEVKNFIETFYNRLSKEGLDFNFTDKSGQTKKFKMNVVTGGDSSVELVKLDSSKLANQALKVGRQGSWWQKIYESFYYGFITKKQLALEVAIEDEFIKNLQDYLKQYSDQPRNAGIKIKTISPLSYELLNEQSGTSFDWARLETDLKNNLSRLLLLAIEVKQIDFLPTVTVINIQSISDKLSSFFNYSDISLNFIDPQTKIRRDWTLTPQIYASWLEVIKADDGQFIFSISKDEFKKYLASTVSSYVEQAVKDAKFVMENGKANQFQASQSGIKIDSDKTHKDLSAAFNERNYNTKQLTKTVGISYNIIEPKIKMADANNLGISNILGIGVSTFRDSHTNRIKNIANAVKRLNGVLIKPGEVFSTNKYAGPYETAYGYLPEEVIVGNEIKKEVGGGMCQIGTTLFRMAMNSGMPITERVNHSLVVGYYADPVNGNPGTDATVYEPYVDFKFSNDTGNYLLLQTEIDYNKQQLTFILWGKNDGRSGSYTHPEVTKWIPAGVVQETKVITLNVGEKKCQNSFVGAVANFIYTRFTSTSQKIDRVFESYYRPLPQMCVIGVSLADYCKENQTSSACVSSTVSATTTQL